MNIEWKDSYLIGDGRIDVQHRHLFKLADLVVTAPDQNEFRLAAMQLYGYMRTHFSDEEIVSPLKKFQGVRFMPISSGFSE